MWTLTALTFLASLQDTIAVHADGPGAWGSRLRVIEELRIGQVDGPEEYQLNQLFAMAVRRDGDIFVFDAQAPAIRQYDARGRYVRTIGRKGAGPGEYQQVLGMELLRDGRLATWDLPNARISLFDSTGRYLDGIRHPLGFHAAEVFAVDTADRFYVKALDPSVNPASDMEPDLRAVFLRLNARGQVTDRLRIPALQRAPTSFVLATPQGYRAPFERARVSALSNRGYLVSGDNDRYELLVPRDSHSVIRITRKAERAAVQGGERAMWEAWARHFEKGGPRHYSAPPDRKPFFRRLWVDEEGRIWVDRYVAATRLTVEQRPAGDPRPPYDWRESPTFDLFEPSGTFLGTVTLPRDSYPYRARGRLIWAEIAGPLREPYIIRLRVEPEP